MIRNILICLIGLSFLAASAQIQQPVTWKIDVEAVNDSVFEIQFLASIDDGFHLYSVNVPENGPLPTEFIFEEAQAYKILGPAKEVTKPVVKYDETFKMDIAYFEEEAEFSQRFVLQKPDTNLIGVIAYMVCNDVGCVALYEDLNFAFEDGKFAGRIIEEPLNAEASTLFNQTAPVKDAAELGEEIQGKNKTLWGFFIVSFLAGLAAILTPCVFPMIPMTVSFFMKDKESKSAGRFQATVYGFSIIGIYTFIGSILAVVAGPDIANFLSTHWLPNILFFLIFVIFAASFFGMFEITLPHWIVNRSDKQADKGGVIGALFMAVTLVLVSFSCTGPIVGTILVASAGGEVIKPIVGMFGFSLAFALPFTLFAFFPSWLQGLPKSGGWLNSVKVVLGFLELALGLKFLSIADQTYHWGILDREVYLAFWIVIFALMGLYLLGKLRFAHDSEVKTLGVPRLALAIATFTFVVYMIPGMFGAPLKFLSGYLPPQQSHDFDLNTIIRENVRTFSGSSNDGEESPEVCETPKFSDFLHLPHGLEGYFDYEEAVACAKKLNKPIFIDFTGHGCVNCREMEATVWSDPKVLKILQEEYVVLALYVDDKKKLPEEEWIVSEYDGKTKKTIGRKYADFQISKFGTNAQPYYVLMGHNGEVLAQPRAYDLDVDEFVDFLESGLNNFDSGISVAKIK